MATKFRERDADVELTDGNEGDIDPAGDTDTDDDTPVRKTKAKSASQKRRASDDEDAPKPKLVKKRVKVDSDDEKEEEAPKKVAKATKASKNGKASKKERKARQTNLEKFGIPFDPDSMIGKGYLKAQNGIAVEKLKAFFDANKEGKKGGAWGLTRLRSGQRRDGTCTWPVMEKDGVIKLGAAKAA